MAVERFRPGVPRLRPVATAIDTFVRPATPAPPQRPAQSNALMDLAGALRQVSPRIDSFLQSELERQRQDAELEAAGTFMTGELPEGMDGLEFNRQSWHQLIEDARRHDRDNGTAYADQLTGMNPHFRRGYNRAYLDSMGMALEDHILTQWAANPDVTDANGATVGLMQTDDMGALQSWVQDQTSAFIRDNGLDTYAPGDIAEFFAPRAADVQNRIAARHNAYRLDARQEEYGNAFSQNIGMTVGGVIATGDVQGGIAALQSRLDQAVADGMSPSDANELLVNSVVSTAVTTGDHSVLDLLQGVSTGHGSLGQIGWVQERVVNARRSLAQFEQSQWRHSIAVEAHRRDTMQREIESRAVSALMEDPTAGIEAYQTELIAAGLPMRAYALEAMREGMIQAENTRHTDPDAHVEILSMIVSAGSETDLDTVREQIVSFARQGLLTADDAESLLARADLSGNVAIGDPFVRETFETLETQLADLYGGYVDDPMAIARSKLDLNDRITTWVASETERTGSRPSDAAIARFAQAEANAIYEGHRAHIERQATVGPGEGAAPSSPEVPQTMSLLSLEAAAPGSVQINRDTLSEADIVALYNDHLAHQGNSILSSVATRHDMDPDTMMSALMGVSDPFGPQTPEEGGSDHFTAEDIEDAARAIGLNPEAAQEGEPSATIAVEPDATSFQDILTILEAGWLGRNLGAPVPLGSESSPVIAALSAIGAVETNTNRRSGDRSFTADYGQAVDALIPVMEQWGAQFGVDRRLFEEGDLRLLPGDPLLDQLSGSDLVREVTRGRGSQMVRSIEISEGDKLLAALRLIMEANMDLE